MHSLETALDLAALSTSRRNECNSANKLPLLGLAGIPRLERECVGAHTHGLRWIVLEKLQKPVQFEAVNLRVAFEELFTD